MVAMAIRCIYKIKFEYCSIQKHLIWKQDTRKIAPWKIASRKIVPYPNPFLRGQFSRCMKTEQFNQIFFSDLKS